MRRLAVMAVTYVATLAAAAGVAVRVFGDHAGAAGREVYGHRAVVERLLRPPRAAAPTIAWIGDSTILDRHGYAYGVAAAIDGARSHVIALQGLDAFGYYCLVDRVLGLEPRLVVLIANLRLFAPTVARNDLVSLLPVEALPETALLPLHARGLTIPGVLLARSLAYPAVEEALFVAEGFRRSLWDRLRPAPDVVAQQAVWAIYAGRLIADFDTAVGPRNPMLRFLAATVGRATARSVPVLVIVTPVPADDLAQVGHWAPGRFARRVARIRAAVEAAGGRVLDLHGALGRGAFRDHAGHFNAQGTRQMVERVAPVVRDLLGAPRPPPALAGDRVLR